MRIDGGNVHSANEDGLIDFFLWGEGRLGEWARSKVPSSVKAQWAISVRSLRETGPLPTDSLPLLIMSPELKNTIRPSHHTNDFANSQRCPNIRPVTSSFDPSTLSKNERIV